MKKIFFMMIVLFAGLITNNSHAQATHKLPSMYVEKSIGNERILRFSQIKDSKYEILRKFNTHQDLFFIYTWNAIGKLIEKINKECGIRIYFARYSFCGDQGFPSETEPKKVILLFAKESTDGSAPEEYYFLNDKKADNKVYEVSKECGEDWIKDYENHVLPELLITLIPSEKDIDNEYPAGSKSYSDTKSIYFTKEMIKEAFVDEQGYDHKIKGSPLIISAFKVSFSAYGVNGNGRIAKKDVYKNRLFVQFDYMYNPGTGNEVFYLDDMDDFKQRYDLTFPKQEGQLKEAKDKVDEKKGINNGQLCPTHCPSSAPCDKK